jgi:hypothetical protein
LIYEPFEENSRTTKIWDQKCKRGDLEMTIERMVAVHPSKRRSRTYGFRRTTTIKPRTEREERTKKTVATYVLMTLTRRLAKKVRMMRVIKSANDEARGVAILSWLLEIIWRYIPGLRRNRRDTRTRLDMKELRNTLEILADNMALTIIKALSNQDSRWGLVK